MGARRSSSSRRRRAPARGRELAGAVRRHGAAGVHVRVDQRRERARCLQDGVQVEADLGQPGQVRPEPGQDDHLVDLEHLPALGDQPDAAVRGTYGSGAEATADADGAGLDGGTRAEAEGAACGQLVAGAATEGSLYGGVRASAQQPGDQGAGVPARELGEGDQRRERGVAARRRRRWRPPYRARTSGASRSGTR